MFLLSPFYNVSPVAAALLATLFTYLVTAAGAAAVFLFKDINRKFLDLMMGFAGGVMIAASFWSLLSPATELLEELGRSPFIMTAIGFTAGGLFIILSDILCPARFCGDTSQYSRGSCGGSSLRLCRSRYSRCDLRRRNISCSRHWSAEFPGGNMCCFTSAA